jgi:hypothetical protein
MRRLSPIPLLVTALILAAAPLAAAAAPADAAVAEGAAPQIVLVNQPAASVCVGRRFTVGVWYQQISGGSRAYRVAVYGPAGKRLLYKHGRASSAHWRFWKVRAVRPGKYRTVYSGHWKHPTVWSHYKVTTRARRCS